MSDDNSFTVKDYDRIIDDIMNEFFEQHDMNYDLKELMKNNLLGEDVPEGYHRMPSGELMLDSEMPQIEGN